MLSMWLSFRAIMQHDIKLMLHAGIKPNNLLGWDVIQPMLPNKAKLLLQWQSDTRVLNLRMPDWPELQSDQCILLHSGTVQL